MDPEFDCEDWRERYSTSISCVLLRYCGLVSVVLMSIVARRRCLQPGGFQTRTHPEESRACPFDFSHFHPNPKAAIPKISPQRINLAHSDHLTPLSRTDSHIVAQVRHSSNPYLQARRPTIDTLFSTPERSAIQRVQHHISHLGALAVWPSSSRR